jgi:16S rRNA (uracil1498-N3)-methyltransferase
MSELFYTAEPVSDILRLSEQEARHLVKVLRYGTGDRIRFTDGKGSLITAVLTDTHFSNCVAAVESVMTDFGKRPYRLHLAIAPTKNTDRFEWMLEKATEFGVDEITPVICARSERRDLRSDRLQKILLSAMKQSFQTFLPVLNEPVSFSDLITRPSEHRFICHLESENPTPLKNAAPPGGNHLVLVGPEGDFGPEEIALAKENGFRCVSLGPTRLRTETAGVAVCCTYSLLHQ